MPSGGAVKPSDIVTTMSGQTVEILNTDAEGRLVLCDAITYSRRFKPAAVIDVATLTGACIIALGNHFSGLMSNNEALAEELPPRASRADDRAWRLPIGEEYVEQLKSNFADHRQRRRPRGRRLHRGLVPVEIRQGSGLGAPRRRRHGLARRLAKGSTGRPVPLLVDFLLHRAARRADRFLRPCERRPEERRRLACRLAEKAYLARFARHHLERHGVRGEKPAMSSCGRSTTAPSCRIESAATS
jgi:leucyl aminopeptidase